MPPVEIKYVVSFTSQDDKHPVSNLVKGDGFKKWLSHPHEKSGQTEAVFQLEQSCVISYVDIGSVWCATLEIKVGRSDWPAGREFETLAYTVNLMTPADCLTNKNPNKTQMFSTDMFCPDVAKKQWDRIKVICRQPYKKMVQFGLSFLRVKTSLAPVSSPPCERKGNSLVSTSVKDIQKHFMERLDNGVNKRNDQLKSRLLKIAASSDNGIEHDESLSRTAKLVLAASGNKPKSYTANSSVPNVEKIGMYSSRVEQNYAPQFAEDVDDFLKELVIDPSELDSITMADVRHKFERKKRRKLTKDEKKIFIQKATKHLTSAFKDKTNQNVEKENLNSKTQSNALPNSNTNTHKTENNGQSRGRGSSMRNKESLDGKNKKPSVKRKLDNDVMTPPRKKVAKESSSPLTVIQKLKSNDDQSSGEKKDLIGQLKKARQAGPMADCVASPGTPFHYKGLRGRESDFDSQLIDTASPAGTTTYNPRILNEGKGICYPVPDKCSFSPDTAFPGKAIHLGSESSSDDDVLYSEAEVTGRRGRGRGRGGHKGRGRGRGRGRGKQPRTPVSNCVSDDLSSDVCTPKARGRGRGRGKRGGRGATSTPVQQEKEVTVVQEEMPAPRGFTRCSGCRDYFGDAVLNAHEQRCAALRTKRKSSGESVSSCSGQVLSVNMASTTPVQARNGPSTNSMESPTKSFIKCDGCDQFFVGTLLPGHPQKCILCMKDLNKTDMSSTFDSPWLSAKKTNTTIGQRDSGSVNRSSDQRLETNKGCVTSHEGQRSACEPIRSPPWLLAAERRLQEQQNSSPSQNSSITSSSCTGGVSSPVEVSNTSLNSSRSSSSLPSPVTDSQQGMIEKYERQGDTEATQDSQSQSLLQNHAQNSSSCARNSLGCLSAGGMKGRQAQRGVRRRQSAGITRNRFSAIELSDDSDDDDDDDDIGRNRDSSAVNVDGGLGVIQVECPLCGDFYPSYLIEAHASSCYL